MKIHWHKATYGAAIGIGLMGGALTARAGGCCGTADATNPHSGHGAAVAPSAATPLPEPLPAVLDSYLKIEAALAKDSLDGVVPAATAISKLADGDTGKALPAAIGAQAGALARAKDLAGTRAAFKALSAALIQQLEQAKAQTDRYYQVYCAMAQAGWLQDNRTVANPYYGQSMARCGEIKKTF